MYSRLLTCSLILAAGLPALAGPDENHPGRPGRNMPSFQELDANKDGKLTSDEFRTQQEKTVDRRFERLDRDHDGKISSNEFEQAGADFRDRMHRRMGDGPAPEGLPGMPHFDEVDTTGDSVGAETDVGIEADASGTSAGDDVASDPADGLPSGL